jgi:hypothetical protein
MTAIIEDYEASPGNSGLAQTAPLADSGSSDPIPTLVIGDVHGHLDRLEALLKQEGLLDRCPDCDGSGIWDASLFTHDLATESGMIDCPACHGDGWRRTDKRAEVVLLGDVGHFGYDGSTTGDLLTWRFASTWADVILWGNHDRAAYSGAHQFNGYEPPVMETRHVIGSARAEGKVKLAHVAHNFLLTHAGLSSAFQWQQVDDPEVKTDPEKFAAWINEAEDPDWPFVVKAYADLEVDDRSKVAVRDAIGRRRGGMSSYSGILWRDITEGLYAPFRQVFGHSADHEEHKVRYCHGKTQTRDYQHFMRATRGAAPSYCIDIGGKGARPGDQCLAGIWLPSEEVVTVRFD